ncbi:MAG: glycosyltransferase [Candidatus Jorgensenbacteria bacterium]|nr:glycosyltransferase [Candidatus Jorgensenbacteria bacterium]
MRVLHIVPSYYPAHRYGGPIQSVHNLNKGLVLCGVDVTVYTTSVNGPDDLDVPIGIPVDIDGVKVYYFKPGFFRFWFYSDDLRKSLAKNIGSFDLIHITSVFLFASTLGAYYAKKYKKPFIISPRGSLMGEPIKRKSSILKRLYIYLVERHSLKGSILHFTAEVEREEYKKLNLPMKDSFIIPNGLDFSQFDVVIESNLFRNKFNIPKEKSIILFLGRISWKKGFDTLIPAFKKISVKNAEALLVVAGVDDEGYMNKIKEEITRLNLEDRVIFTGEILGNMKVAAFRESNVFVLPSYSENFGMAVVEAMSCELPVVITDGVGISGDIKNANAGIVIHKDEDVLADAVLSLLVDRQSAKEIGKRGRQFVRAEYAGERMAEKMFREYNKIINDYA